MKILPTPASAQPETTATPATPSKIEAPPTEGESKTTFIRYLHNAAQFTSFDCYTPEDFSSQNTEVVIHSVEVQPGNGSKIAQAIGAGTMHRAALFPLESITTRLMLGEAPKGNYFRGVGACIATGAAGKAASMSSNKVIRDTLEDQNIAGASLIAGVATGAVETALNPLNVIAQQAKMLPSNELLPALKKIPLKGYYSGGAAMIGQNLMSAGLWYHGNAIVRNKEDSLAVESAKSGAVAAATSTLTWPLHLIYIQRIGVSGVSRTYRELVKSALKEGVVKGLRLRAFFPYGILRVIISGALLGPLINRFNEK
jgi:hypothetical protein